MSKKKNKNTLYVIGGMILVGVFSTAIWERLFSPLSDSIISSIAGFFSVISKYYLNSLYDRIGSGDKEVFSQMSHAIIFIFFLTSMWFISWLAYKKGKRLLNSTLEAKGNRPKKDDTDKETVILQIEKDTKKELKIMKFGMFPFMLVLSLLFIASVIGDLYQYRAILYIERSIEILSPAIPNEKYLELRAMYRSIDNKEKFIELDNKLQKLATELKIKLPEFKVVQ